MIADHGPSTRCRVSRILAVCIVWLAFAGYMLVSTRREPRIPRANPRPLSLALEVTKDAPADAFGFRPAQGLETHLTKRQPPPIRDEPEGGRR